MFSIYVCSVCSPIRAHISIYNGCDTACVFMKSVGIWFSTHLLYGRLHRDNLYILHSAIYLLICIDFTRTHIYYNKTPSMCLAAAKSYKALPQNRFRMFSLCSTQHSEYTYLPSTLFSRLLSHQMSLQCSLSRAVGFWTWLFHYIAFTNWPHNKYVDTHV